MRSLSWSLVYYYSRLFFNSLIDGTPSSVKSFGLYEAESPNPKFKFDGKLFGVIPDLFVDVGVWTYIRTDPYPPPT